MGGEAMYGSPALADVDLDGDLEVLVGSGELYGWHHTGVEIVDGDGDPRTEGVLAPHGTGGYRSSIAVGELDGDLYPEIVGAAWGDVGPQGSPAYEVWAWNAEDGTVLDGWPVTTSRLCWATPALGDLDHDGLDEVILPCANGYLYAWKADGTELIDGDNNPGTQGIFANLRANFAYASPALADLDQDNELEILVASRCESVFCFNPDGSSVPGWPVNMGASSRSSIAVGDVNNNGQLEVVATANNNQVRLLSASGTTFPNWPVSCVLMGDDFASSPTLADLDGDDDLEIIIVSSDGEIHVWTWEGDIYPGWPQTMTGAGAGDKRSSVSVGDIDGDSEPEILTGATNGKVYAFHTDGSVVAGWPIQVDAEVHSTPALADLDGDGDVEVVVSGMDIMVYVWDTPGAYAGGDGVEWGTFRHNNRRSGLYGYEEEVGVPAEGVWSVSEARLRQNVPNPFNPVTTICYVLPEGGDRVLLEIFDAAGRHVRTLIDGYRDGGSQSVAWGGDDEKGRTVASGIYFYRLVTARSRDTKRMVLLK
jgi:hypothetical protein